MKILIISLWSISSKNIGGTEKFVIDSASLFSRGHNVTVLSLGKIDLNIKNVQTVGLNIVNNLNEYSLFQYLKKDGFTEIKTKLESFIKNNHFDIVHCNSLLFVGLIKKISIVHTVHTNWEEFHDSFPKDIFNMILQNIKKDKNTVFVTPSQYAKKSFFKLTRKKSLVIKHCFRPDIVLQDKVLLKEQYKIPQDNIVFCVPSRLEIKQKGQEILLKALCRLKGKLPPFTVVLGGCDNQYLRNKKYLYKNYPNLNLIIKKFDSKNQMYSLSDIIVLPSRTESFGYSALESAMIGFPLFLSDIPPYKEIAKGNPRIFLFKNNINMLKKILISRGGVINRHKIISPPKSWVTKYCEITMFQKYISLYKKILIKNNSFD